MLSPPDYQVRKGESCPLNAAHYEFRRRVGSGRGRGGPWEPPPPSPEKPPTDYINLLSPVEETENFWGRFLGIGLRAWGSRVGAERMRR